VRSVLLVAVGLVFLSSLAFAQAGSIGIFADSLGSSCNLTDRSPEGARAYYVVHVSTSGATVIQYRAKLPQCMTQTGAYWLYDVNPWLAIGNSQTGVQIGYGQCKTGSIWVQTIKVHTMGLTGPCCSWYVDADPSYPEGKIVGTDCEFNLIYPTGARGIVNPVAGCDCDNPTGIDPVETTWGQVKILYIE
jgi:hypothetical protein